MNTASVELLANGSATSASMQWPGGQGMFTVTATGYGSVSLQYLGPNGSTWITPPSGTLTADGGFVFELPPCPIRASVVAATAVYARADRIPV